MDITFDVVDSQPNLVNSDAIQNVEKLIVCHNVDTSKNFYNEYIIPNILPLIFLGIITLFLLLKYILKKQRSTHSTHTSH